MPIVFDEITAEIAPSRESGNDRSAREPAEHAASPRTLEEDFRHWQRRESRLYAD